MDDRRTRDPLYTLSDTDTPMVPPERPTERGSHKVIGPCCPFRFSTQRME